MLVKKAAAFLLESTNLLDLKGSVLRATKGDAWCSLFSFLSSKAWNATTEPHAPPLFKKQLEAIRASNARGTVEEFHDLLSSLSDDISGSGPGSDPGTSSSLKKVAHETREHRHPAFVSLCAAVLSAQTRDRAAIRGIQQLAQRLGIQQRGKDLDFSPEAIALAPPGLVEECLKGV